MNMMPSQNIRRFRTAAGEARKSTVEELRHVGHGGKEERRKKGNIRVQFQNDWTPPSCDQA